jgi:transaldolase
LESLQGTHIALCSRGLLRFDRLAKLDLSSGLSYRRGAMGGFAITTAPEISIRRRVAPPVSSTRQPRALKHFKSDGIYGKSAAVAASMHRMSGSRRSRYLNRCNAAGGAMSRITDLKVRIFADGADYEGIVNMSKNPVVKGFTTNPSLMRKAAVSDYEAFARKVLGAVPDRPVSFEVFADDFASMAEQARTISAWGPNVNVKIPITNTKGQSSGELLRVLSSERLVLNVTAIFTLDQVRIVADALDPATPAIVSVFAGRIADTGVDPIPHMLACKQILNSRPKAQLLWASTREVLNIFHAEQSGCDIITVPNEFLSKLGLIDKDLVEYSRETVQAFHRDATAAAYQIRPARFAAE